MTEAGCQNVVISSAFPFQRTGFFMRHFPRNPFTRNEEEEWLFQDTGMVDHSPPSIAAFPTHSPLQRDSEQGPSVESPSPGRSPRETTILDEDDIIVEVKEAKFYRWSFLKEFLFILTLIGTGGLAMVICLTWPRLYMKLRFVQVEQNDEDAERVLVESMDGSLTMVDIMWILEKEPTKTWISSCKARFSDESTTNRPRMFEWREERFWYNHQNGSWTRRDFNTNLTYGELHSIASNCALKEIGHDPEENKRSDSRERRNLVYGPNELIVKVPDFWQLLVSEVFKPFFLFQVFSIIFWICSSYEIYAYVILTLTTITILYNVIETRQNLIAIKKLAASECELKRLTLMADESAQLRLRPVLVSSSELLPGDIVQIEAGMIFPCDLVLLAGQCIVNESMLTGESAPVPKTPLPLGFASFGQVFQVQSEHDGRYKLLCGTKALQVRSSCNPHKSISEYELESLQPPSSIWQFLDKPPSVLNPLALKEDPIPVAAMVISTAYGTAKGQLIRAILFPKPSKYDFEQKTYYFLANLGIYLIFVCIVTVIWQVGKETNLNIFKNCVNLLTIAVPPALPLALSIGLSVSFTRLQQKAIYCINPNRIINAGRINTLCFDKTGTLTEDGLSLKGVLPVLYDQSRNNSITVTCGALEEELQSLYICGVCDDNITMSSLGLFYTLAAAHSISLLDQDTNYDPLIRGEASNTAEHNQPGCIAWLCKGWKSSESGAWYSKHRAQDSDGARTTDQLEQKSTNIFIGDPLEVEMFSKTGWRYLSRPNDQTNAAEEALELPILWDIIHPSIDTLIIPPSELNSSRILAVMRRFDFDSEIRLMSSIVLELPFARATFEEARIWLLIKGAPESLQEVCDKTLLPQDFNSKLQELTLDGYRVLACGYRLLGSISLQQIAMANRSQMEVGIIFSGFIVMENKLKSETPHILQELAKAGLREVMVTGDNPLTAISVSRQCGPFFLRSSCRTFLIDLAIDGLTEPLGSGCSLKDVDSQVKVEFDTIFSAILAEPGVIGNLERVNTTWRLGAVDLVVTGRAFSALSTQHDKLREKFMEETGSTTVKISDCVTPFQMILSQANIFSRMSPQNKLDLMRSLQDLGYVVCMTGDGANDSRALKAADVGISIASKPLENNDTMAAGPSIAAPFNTKLAHIGVVPMVLAEGRCALVNATVMFKYMYFYALIQATAVMVLYKYDLELYVYQYLWADLGLVFPMVLFMPATKPRKELSRGRPESNLLAFPILLSVYGQSIFTILFQAVAQVFLQQQTWYENPNDKTHGRHDGNDSAFSTIYNQNSTVSFLFSSFQYVGMALALSQSFGMFRCSPFSNLPLIGTIIGLYVLCSIFMLKPMPFSMKAFSMVDLSQHMNFLYGLWIMAMGNSLLFIIFERYAVKHKSTEMDMRTVYDEEMEASHLSAPNSLFHRAMVVLKGEGENCNVVMPIVPDYLKVSEAANLVWARLISS
ncbi:unnamed protein product [Calypogeia fissa]